MGKPLRTLIVEDSENDALLVLRELERGGYDATFERVETAEAMTAALEKQTWDVIIADYNLPHFSAPEALKLLQQSGLDLPFIVISGTVGEEAAVATMKAGAHDYLMKDNLTRLVPAVERELREADVRKERKRAEEALRESEKRYRLLAENAKDVIWTVDMNMRPTYMSPSITRLLGYSIEEAMDLPMEAAYTSASFETARKVLAEELVIENMEQKDLFRSRTLELELNRKDGSIVLVEVNFSLIREPDGRPAKILAIARDITERKQARQQIARQNAILSAVNKIFREAITCENEEQLTMTCLAVAEELTGSKISYIREVNEKGRLDTIAMSETGWAKCNVPGSREPLLRKNLKVRGIRGRVIKDEKSYIFNDPMTHPDWLGIPRGHQEITSFLGVPLKQAGRTIGMIALANKKGGYDLADKDAMETLSGAIVEAWMRKRAEQAIEQAAEEWRTTFDSVADWISIHDKDFRLIRVNKAFASAFNMKPQEVLGRTCYELVHGLKEPWPDCPHKQTLEDGKPHRAEFFEPHLGIHMEVACSPIFDEGGGVAATVHIMRDITERKKMEGQLLVNDRLASIGELASGVAHELNNPLTGIIGFAELLLDKDVPDDIKEDLKIIHTEAQRTSRVVRNLLTFARKHEPVKQMVDLNCIIRKVLDLRAYEQKVNNIQVNTRFAHDLPEILADGFKLQQVFLNIVINAEYFMIEAHGRGVFTITAERVGDIIRVSFADDGPGIARENLGHLFDPFFTTKEVGRGTGLGLSICHGIITEHDGRIYVESELGKGATFVVELPVSQQ